MTRTGRVVTEDLPVLWAIVAILLLFWVLGLVANVAGGLVHILLAIAVIVIVLQFLQGRRSV